MMNSYQISNNPGSPFEVKSAVYHDLDSNKLLKQDMFVLLNIYRIGKVVSSELAKSLFIEKSSMSRSLNSLRKKDYIQMIGIRVSKESGKVNSVYQISNEGKKILATEMRGAI